MPETVLVLLTSIITGGLTLIGVIYTTRKQHDITTEEIKSEIQLIKKDINILEEKQDKHNQIIERVYQLEIVTKVLDERQKVANNRIDDLEELERNVRNEN